MAVDLPPVWQETVQCVLEAAPRHGVPANIVLAIAELEGGAPYTWGWNRDGSIDYGRMRINSVHLAEFGRYGISPVHLVEPGCYPIDLATWMIGRHLMQCRGDVWQCAANYNSKTPGKNAIYRAKLIPAAGRWARWLWEHYPTIEYAQTR
jgi:hypothetical protein